MHQENPMKSAFKTKKLNSTFALSSLFSLSAILALGATFTVTDNAAQAAGAASANLWNIDSSHSDAGFAVKHLMISNVKGTFTNVAGTVEYDGKNPNSIKVDATIDTTTVNTGDKGRDEHLRGADFFDTEKFPKMTFKSKKVKSLGKGKVAITGDLTIKGVTKEVVLTVDGPSKEVKDPWGNTKIAASATTKIQRKDFGISYNKVMDNGGTVISDDVAITLEIEAGKKAEK